MGFIRTNAFTFDKTPFFLRSPSLYRVSPSRNYAFKRVGRNSYVALALTASKEKSSAQPVERSDSARLDLGETKVSNDASASSQDSNQKNSSYHQPTFEAVLERFGIRNRDASQRCTA